VQSDPGYIALKEAFEQSRAVSARAEQKLELAKTDRADKSKPYESDPLFSYLSGSASSAGLSMARAACRRRWTVGSQGSAAMTRPDPNYARLIELPDRIGEHLANMRLEEAEAQAAIERFEAQALEARGAVKLSTELNEAKDKLKALDAALASAEATYTGLRAKQEQAARGDAGPQEQARRVIEEGLAKASFPDLKVLAAETTTPEDDRIVDVRSSCAPKNCRWR